MKFRSVDLLLLQLLVTHSQYGCNSCEVATIITLILFTGSTSVTILQGPQDATVYEGQSAGFSCTYSGTTGFPVWYIDGVAYFIQGQTRGLPQRHIYYNTNQTMTIRNVKLSDNERTYRCAFFGGDSSGTATLTVISAPQGTMKIMCIQ